MKKQIIVIILVLAVVFLLSGCKQNQEDAALYGDGQPTKVQTEEKPLAAEKEEAKEVDAPKAVDEPKEEVKAPKKETKITAPTEAEIAAAKKKGTVKATIKTEKGDIVVEMYGSKVPLTVANFVKLSKAGFYDGLTFHRVEPGFVIQGGDPQGTGAGGPGYSIKREIASDLKHVEGALAMARSQHPDSAGSQFYITLDKQPGLDNEYAVFGKVITGMDVVKSIKIGNKIISVTINN